LGGKGGYLARRVRKKAFELGKKGPFIGSFPSKRGCRGGNPKRERRPRGLFRRVVRKSSVARKRVRGATAPVGERGGLSGKQFAVTEKLKPEREGSVFGSNWKE